VTLALADIEALFARRGAEQYSGEPVTQLEHALQCATLAEAEGADDELVTAALLHDIGHLTQDLGDSPTLRGIDDRHQHAALPRLKGLFSARVLGAIGLHVDAKRYLCATRPGYHAALSDDSKRSLVLQGGAFDGQGRVVARARSTPRRLPPSSPMPAPPMPCGCGCGTTSRSRRRWSRHR
jgi:predicted HD phosphohydrolase